MYEAAKTMFILSATVANMLRIKTVQLHESHVDMELYLAVIHIQKQFTPCTPAATIAVRSVASPISFLSAIMFSVLFKYECIARTCFSSME